MSLEFNLNGLKDVYLETLKRSEPTLAFEVLEGHGRLAFMMFFSDRDKESKDRLFVLLRNIQVLLELKVYGNHWNGDFIVYFKESDRLSIIKELQLGQGGQGFNFLEFLGRLNEAIPATLPLQKKLDTIRKVWPLVGNQLRHVVDEPDKTILIGIKKLPEGNNPREKTLKKLYMCTKGEAEVITNMIRALKAARITLVWTSNQEVAAKSLEDIMEMINA